MLPNFFQDMAQSVIAGDVERATRLAQQVIQQGIDPLQAINAGFVPGMNYVGEQFGCGELFLPDLYMAGQALKAAVAVLEPEMTRQGRARQVLGRVVLGTVEGDIHDIGKTLVGTMLTANGFQVYDLGVNVSAQKFIEMARQVDADIVGLSTLLTTTMIQQRKFMQALAESGLRERVKVMVGGAPVTRGWAAEIGADGYSEDAMGAVGVAKELLAIEG